LARHSWAGADIFISLSDNVQETFGITPIEAMAAGLPVIVSDWNGYKDTVRDGVDGFRIPTFMPPPNLGENFAKMHEAGTITYDIYCGLSCQTVSISMVSLIEKLTLLVENSALRQKMGAAGKNWAQTTLDWRVVYPQYQNLYEQLHNLRLSAQQNATWQATLQTAPRLAASRLDPFYSFRHYPTALIQPTMRVALQTDNALTAYSELMKNPLFNYAVEVLPNLVIVEKIVNALNSKTLNLQELSQQIGGNLGETVLAIAVLVKMDLMRFV